MWDAPKILIVDDEPRMCESLKALLNYQGYEAYTSLTGSEAVEHLSRDHFDLVLLDMVMPDISGQRVMDYVRSFMPETLVIVITAYASLESAVEALRGGAFDYVRKPLDCDELLARVEYAIDQRRRLKEVEDSNRKLRISEKRYRYLINSSPDIIYTLDSQGKFTFINRAGWALLGYETNHLIGEHYSSVLFEEDLEKARYYIHERRTGERAATGVQIRLKVRHNGNEIEPIKSGAIVVELNAKGLYDRPVDVKERRFLGTLGVARDISFRKRLEARQRYAQKMESIRTLAGGIAHEFNNLLQVILGYSELLLLNKEQGELRYDELKEIVDAARKGGKLTQQLLTFSLKTGSKRKRVELNQEIRQFRGAVLRILPSTIDVQVSLAEPLYLIHADTVQIGQLLMNLTVNARDAMPKGGRLFIRTANVTLDEQYCRMHLAAKPGNYVQLTISDTGHGMDKETQRHIFEPFFTTKQTGHGTGLGLAAVCGIVKSHGGHITCDSKPGVGSAFRVLLPASEPIERPSGKAATPSN